MAKAAKKKGGIVATTKRHQRGDPNCEACRGLREEETPRLAVRRVKKPWSNRQVEMEIARLESLKAAAVRERKRMSVYDSIALQVEEAVNRVRVQYGINSGVLVRMLTNLAAAIDSGNA